MVDEGDLPKGEIVEQYPTVEGTVVERTPVVNEGSATADESASAD
jgi:hypothetical protein